MESFLDNLNRKTQPSQPWYVRFPARIMSAASMIVYLPVFVFVILPLFLIAMPVFLLVGWWNVSWTRPRMIGRLRRAGRVDDSGACLDRWRMGEGTLIREFDFKSAEVWWTPDQIPSLDADLEAWKPGRSREEAEACARASMQSFLLGRQYTNKESGTAVLLPRMSGEDVKALAGSRRVIDLCVWLACEDAHWWHFMDGRRCGSCGYDLGGLGDKAVCPECGAAGRTG